MEENASIRKNKNIRMLTAFGLLIIFILGLVYAKDIGDNIDESLILILGFSVVLIVVPIERIKSFKFGGLEFALNEQVKAAIDSFASEDRAIINNLIKSIPESNIRDLVGSKILWIDDFPGKVAGERRLFRALGVEIVPISSKEELINTIRKDHDFDIIISDIQWKKRDEYGNEIEGGGVTYGGIDCVKDLRTKFDNPELNEIHVIFYTGYKESQISIISNQTNLEQIANHSISFDIHTLIGTCINKVVEIRKNTITLQSVKSAS